MQGVFGDELPELFSTASQMGFDGVELDWFDLNEVRAGAKLGPANRAAIKLAAREADVEIASVAAHFLNDGGLAHPDEAKQQVGLEAVRLGLALCHELGATVLLVPFFGAGDIGGPDGVERLERHLRELAPAAEKAKVTIAIEHSLPGAEAAALLKRVDSPCVADYWDMANCLAFGFNPLQEMDALAGHMAQVHAKEYCQGAGPKGLRAMPRYDGLNTKRFGEGDVPVERILAALREHNYKGYIVLETGAFGDKKASARAALDLLKGSA